MNFWLLEPPRIYLSQEMERGLFSGYRTPTKARSVSRVTVGKNGCQYRS